MLDEKSWIKTLVAEGFTQVRVCPLPPDQDSPEHGHDEHTVHVILTGELAIADSTGTRTFRPGQRVEFPAGTHHRARGRINNGTMITGVKKFQTD